MKSDPNIIITRPDKGKGVVILDRVPFETKVDNILNDNNTFKRIDGDLFSLIIKLEDKFNRILRTIKSNIGENLYKSLYASGTRPGILYCLPKIHKVNTPLRPIISSINTAGYKIAKFLVPFLSNLTVNDYTLKDSATFVNYIKDLNLPPGFVMSSFDVTNLFTNVPLKETTEIILNSYNPASFFNISKTILKKIISICHIRVHFYI